MIGCIICWINGKNHFEATYSCPSCVSRKLPPARMNMRSQSTSLPPSQKLGKVSELIRSLLETGEFCGVPPMFLYSVGALFSTRTQERFCLKTRYRTCTTSAKALFFGQLQSGTLSLHLCLSQQHTLRQNGKFGVDLDQMFCL